MSTLAALTLIGLALFIGGLLLRRVPTPMLVVGAIFVAFGLGIPAIVIDDNKEDTGGGGGAAAASSETGGGGEEAGGGEAGGGGGSGGASGGGAAANEEGKLVFTQSCGTCHTLADAGTSGQVGPVLDDLKPSAKQVEDAIKNGGTGSGTMPANIVTGKDAQAVADYVADVSGK